MNNNSLKNILIISGALIGITIVATIIVLGFNHFVGLSTDIKNNDDVATAIAAVAFGIGVILKFIYDKKEEV